MSRRLWRRSTTSSIRLDCRILSTGQWKNGKIHINRAEIRWAARASGVSVRQILYDTTYHERWHGHVEPVGRLVSWCLGVDDIYEFSLFRMTYEQGGGYWYRTEEWTAEAFGRWYSRRRARFQRRRSR